MYCLLNVLKQQKMMEQKVTKVVGKRLTLEHLVLLIKLSLLKTKKV